MNKLPNSNSESSNETNAMQSGEEPPGMPRWMKVSGIIAIVLILLFIVMHLFGGGKMGPMRHMSHMPSSSGIEQGVNQPG